MNYKKNKQNKNTVFDSNSIKQKMEIFPKKLLQYASNCILTHKLLSSSIFTRHCNDEHYAVYRLIENILIGKEKVIGYHRVPNSSINNKISTQFKEVFNQNSSYDSKTVSRI